jgi:hypothetical protein
MKISYAITVCNEFIEIQRLLTFLLEHKRPQDEIVVLVDLTKNEPTSELLGYLHKLSSNNQIVLGEDRFQNHFANWKNQLTKMCSGDFIMQIDADEIPNEDLIQTLPEILEINPEMDVYLVPRINTVEGITTEHVAKWGWNITDTGWINFPDYQCRIWKNKPEIKWKNKVHEVLEGFKTYTALPDVEYFALFHPKTIEKQEKQNQLYETI